MTPIDLNSMLDTVTVAALIGIKPQSLVNYRYAKKSPIPYTRIGAKLIRYRYADVLAYLDSQPKFAQ
jgi:hypothetical protein